MPNLSAALYAVIGLANRFPLKKPEFGVFNWLIMLKLTISENHSFTIKENNFETLLFRNRKFKHY